MTIVKMQNVPNKSDHSPRNFVGTSCMVVNPGETILEAIARHRRDTGHEGFIIIVALNKKHPTQGARRPMQAVPGSWRHRGGPYVAAKQAA